MKTYTLWLQLCVKFLELKNESSVGTLFLHNFFFKNCSVARNYILHVMMDFSSMILKKVIFAKYSRTSLIEFRLYLDFQIIFF